MVSERPLTLISLYSGAGGMDIGFVRAGFLPIWANDIDSTAAQTYRNAIGSHIRVGDIREQDLPGEGSADVVVGGPPCQGFSVAGHMNPDDPRSRHVWDFLGAVGRIKPRGFVMENVLALAENTRWQALCQDLIRSAEALGYATRLLILNAADYGVPQGRRRMFLLGVRGEATIGRPAPTSHNSQPTVRHALADLPAFGQPGNNTFCTARVTPAKAPVLRRSPYAGMLFNGQGRPLCLDMPALTLPASMGGNRTPIIDQLELDAGGPGWVGKYHARLWAGGKPVTRVPKRLRRLTVEEAAALQTFPREMQFAGTVTAQFRQIGNAVPPRLAFHVAVTLRRAIERQSGLAVDDAPQQMRLSVIV